MTQQQLFRQEAIVFRQQRQWGEVSLVQPVPARVAFWAVVTATTVIIAFLVTAEYARKETVVGYLSPTAGVVKVFAPRQGTITAIHVEEGQRTEQGQPLLTIAIDQTTADGENVDVAVLDSLTRQKSLLVEQIATQQARALSERNRLQAQVAGIESEIPHLKEQRATQEERVRLLESLTSSAENLREKGYLAASEFKRRRETYLTQKQAFEALSQQLVIRQNELIQVRYSLEQLPAVMAEKIQALRSELSDVEQRIAETEGRRAYVVRAPVTGRVATLQAVVGRTADPRQLQLSILPDDSMLQAELFVPTRAVGFVRPDQQVRILYDAFPYQRFGTYEGRVLKVTQTILTSTDIAAPVSLQEPAYKVIVALDRQDITAYGQRVSLQADMLLKADIILERRSLLQWLLDPLLSVRTA
jgi:membrane fusion protein